MNRIVTVLLGDPSLPDRSKPGSQFTPDDFLQIEKLKQALSEISGRRFDFWNDHEGLFRRLREERPEFVLNFCDTGFRNEARYELHIPALLEMLGVPYSGSGPVALGICYDKALVRAVAQAHGVPVPWETFLRPEESLPDVAFPAFIKPNCGDGSIGITEASLVKSRREADAYIARLRAELPGADILVQEFLSGEEYGLGLIGNSAAGFTALPVLQVDYSALDSSLPRLLSYGSKMDPESPYWSDIRFREATLSPAVKAQMKEWCIRLFDRLQLRDYARFDFRADAAGGLKLMEVNPNPAWCWDGKLVHMGKLMGLSHGGVLGLILEAAERRCFGDA
jgi:D-alanine-D-alanine ligase